MSAFLFRPSGLATGLFVMLVAGTAAAQPTVTGRNPAANATHAPVAGPVDLTFSQPLVAATVPDVRVFGSQTGRLAGTATAAGPVLTFTPAQPLRAGEAVQVTVPATVQAGGQAVQPLVYQFTAAVTAGGGTFGGGTDVPIGANAIALACADIDGDRDVDVVTVNQLDSTISVARNDGTGTLGSITRIRVGAWPLDAAPGDVDGDGDVDLLVLNNGDAMVRVLFNDGAGTFSNGMLVAAGFGPTDIELADLDADGDLDLLITNAQAGRVGVRFNNGAGRFTGTTSLVVRNGPHHVKAADMDNDGDLDLVAACSGLPNSPNARLSLRLNDGAGHFTAGPDINVDNSPNSVALADIDGDGDVDVLTSNSPFVVPQQPGSMSIRFNDGAGNFTGGINVPLPDFTKNVVTADIDGDGDPDALVTQQNTGLVKVFTNDGLGHFAPAPDVPVEDGTYDLAVVDLNGDGALDLLTPISGHATASVSVRLNGNPTGLAAGGAEAAFGLWPNPAHGTVRVSGAGTEPVRVLDALGRVVRSAAVDADGRLDLRGLPAGLYVVRARTAAQRLVVVE